MKLLTALRKMEDEHIKNVPFKDLFSEINIDKINKGKVGQLLEILLGLANTSNPLDFEDGELKTNKSKFNGEPLETMFITQISSHIDEMFNNISFEESWLYNKIKRMIYLPVVKESSEPADWFFKEPIYFEMSISDQFFNQLQNDYISIVNQMRNSIENGDGFLHTANGEYIQIRTKDSKPYHPIFSSHYNKQISNKNFAFYFKKSFMKDLLKASDKYPNIC
ncbi:MutH/Sau3AI family endonuclease [Rummeliibacillus sp. JY-2-4R]